MCRIRLMYRINDCYNIHTGNYINALFIFTRNFTNLVCSPFSLVKPHIYRRRKGILVGTVSCKEITRLLIEISLMHLTSYGSHRLLRFTPAYHPTLLSTPALATHFPLSSSPPYVSVSMVYSLGCAVNIRMIFSPF